MSFILTLLYNTAQGIWWVFQSRNSCPSVWENLWNNLFGDILPPVFSSYLDVGSLDLISHFLIFSLIFYILSYYEALLVTAWKYVQSLVTSHICLSPVHPLPPVWAPTAASSAVICLQTLPLRQSVLHTAPRNPLKCEADPVTPLLKSLSVYPLHSE